MYDHFDKMTDEERRKKAWTEKGQEALQTALSSIWNLQHDQTMGELSNIAKSGIPWIEQCRKADHDATQALWRSGGSLLQPSMTRLEGTERCQNRI